MNNNLKYFLVAVGSFLFGWLYYNSKKDINKESDLNKTFVAKKGSQYFIVFYSVVILSREITKEQYDSFMTANPKGKAEGNVIDNFSTPPPRYTIEGDEYFEYVWDGKNYGKRVAITKDEYNFLKNKGKLPEFHVNSL